MPSPTADPRRRPTVNLVVLRGLASAPAERAHASIGCRARDARPSACARSTRPRPRLRCPVAVWEPPAWVETVDTGDPWSWSGALARRFFRTGPARRACASRSRRARSAADPTGAGSRRRGDGPNDALEGLA